MTDICKICLKHDSCLITIFEDNLNTEKTLYKLRNCVPEVEWVECFNICKICEDNLNKAYDFRQLCIKSYASWKNIHFLNEQNILIKKDFNSDNESLISEIDTHYDNELLDDNESGCVKCLECNIQFESEVLLEEHITRAHKTNKNVNQNKRVECEFCKKLYANKGVLQKHLRICKKKFNEGKFATKKVKQSESSKHIATNGKLLELDCEILPTCSLCGTTFCNKYLLKRHTQNVHATEKKYKCDMCERTFASSVYLNAHKRYHAGDRSHICSFCGKGFITASDLYHHEKIHANKRAYRCEICPKAFNTSSDLHKHKICVHIDRSEWKYICSYCQRRFPLKTNLDTHVKTHTGEKNYACHLCDRKCINKSVLARHIETHSNVIAFKCNLCMQGYKYRKSLDLHMAKIHGVGNIKVPEKVKKFFCHLCPKSYFANNKLQKHIRSHSGERPFQCSHCEKSFVDKSYIKQHLKMVHNITTKLEDM